MALPPPASLMSECHPAFCRGRLRRWPPTMAGGVRAVLDCLEDSHALASEGVGDRGTGYLPLRASFTLPTAFWTLPFT